LHINPSKALAVIDHIEVSSRYIEVEALFPEGYTDDIVFAEVFITLQAGTLITGNPRHYRPLLKQNMLVLTPAQF